MDAACNSLKEMSVSVCISQMNFTFCFPGVKNKAFSVEMWHTPVFVFWLSPFAQPGVEHANGYIYKNVAVTAVSAGGRQFSW